MKVLDNYKISTNLQVGENYTIWLKSGIVLVGKCVDSTESTYKLQINEHNTGSKVIEFDSLQVVKVSKLILSDYGMYSSVEKHSEACAAKQLKGKLKKVCV